VNDYIADFQRIRARLPGMAEEDALHAFVRGLRRDIAVELRKQRVKAVTDAIELAAHVGSVVASAPVGGRSSGSTSVAQMDIDDGDGASLDVRLARIEHAVLNAMGSNGAGSVNSSGGLGAQTQTHRGDHGERGGGSRRGGGRGGRFGGRGGSRPPLAIPGVPAAVVEQRRAAGQCFRCGSDAHHGMECPSAPSAAPLN
jgi:hypothetical protein